MGVSFLNLDMPATTLAWVKKEGDDRPVVFILRV
jgi:hypothetical protein